MIELFYKIHPSVENAFVFVAKVKPLVVCVGGVFFFTLSEHKVFICRCHIITKIKRTPCFL